MNRLVNFWLFWVTYLGHIDNQLKAFGFVTRHMWEKVVISMEQQYANVTNKLIKKLARQFVAKFSMNALRLRTPNIDYNQNLKWGLLLFWQSLRMPFVSLIRYGF
jgi:hypothetical protein